MSHRQTRLRVRARSVEKLGRFLSEYVKRCGDAIDIESIDDVVGAEITLVFDEPTHEKDDPIEVRPWYRCGFDKEERQFGSCLFGKPYNPSETEAEIIKRARNRRLDEIQAGYEKRRIARARLLDELYGVRQRG